MRAAACGALAAYPMDLLETLEALRPLQDCVHLLLREIDPVARVQCEVLLGKALAHEHMHRRRSVGSMLPSCPVTTVMQVLLCVTMCCCRLCVFLT